VGVNQLRKVEQLLFVPFTVKKEKRCQQIEDNGYLLLLRAALFESSGVDKNVTAGLAKAFMRYDRNGLDLEIEFSTLLSKEEAKYCFELCKEHMEDLYDSSGYGWDDDDKMRELTEPGARFLLVREWPVEGASSERGELVGFVHFRFTVLGEVVDSMHGLPSLHVYDIHLPSHARRKGLGRHLLTILELVARRESMSLLSLPVYLGDRDTEAWLTAGSRIKGFSRDESLRPFGFDPDMEGFEVFSKTLKQAVKTPGPTPLLGDNPAASASPSLPLPPNPNPNRSNDVPPPQPNPNLSLEEVHSPPPPLEQPNPNLVTEEVHIPPPALEPPHPLPPLAQLSLSPSPPSPRDCESDLNRSGFSDTTDGGWVCL